MATLSITKLTRFIESSERKSFWIGLDVHKATYSVALQNSEGAVITWSAPADPQLLIKSLKTHKIRVKGICYEAGPTGFTLARDLIAANYSVTVAAPNKILRPVTPGSKTDRLDCIKLARFLSKNLLKPIAIPTISEESERDLIRRRHQLTDSIRKTKERIKSLLLYTGMKEPEGLKNWSKQGIENLKAITLPEPTNFVLISHIAEIQYKIKARDIIDDQLDEISKQPKHRDRIAALMSIPGVGFITATAFTLEIYRPERFERKEEIASYLGLAPTVKHSGEKKPKGHIVSVGQKRLRSLLIEASWVWISHDNYARNLYNKFISKSGISQKAITAVARKLAIIMWRLSIEKRAYKPKMA